MSALFFVSPAEAFDEAAWSADDCSVYFQSGGFVRPRSAALRTRPPTDAAPEEDARAVRIGGWRQARPAQP
eukprot:SAG11_NODE_10194_length_848_cov_1.125501_1_plen_70_part_01